MSNEQRPESPLPFRKYGYQTKRISWKELIQIIEVEKDLDKLGRTEEDQRYYQNYRKHILTKWMSMLDYVLCEKLGIDSKIGNDGRKMADEESKQKMIKSGLKKLIPNDFPYYLEERIEHWVYWKLGGSCDEGDVVDVKRLLQEMYPNKDLQFLYWINLPHLQSLPEIDHLHVLCQEQEP